MPVYGLQADVSANPNKNVQLYIPRQTKIGTGDIFLGGTGTGVQDSALNGAKRIFGQTAADTAQAYSDYLNKANSAPVQNIVQQPNPQYNSSDPMASIIGNDPEAAAYYNQAKQAAQLGSRNAMEQLNSRGILNSSVTGDTVTGLEQQAMTNVLPQLYAFQQQKQQQAKQDAYNRMNTLGYADNQVSTVLGIPVGTPSASYSMQMAGLTGRINPTQTSSNSYLLGGTAVIPEGTQGQRLAGYTAPDTEQAIKNAAPAILAQSSKNPVTVYYRNPIDLQNAQKYLGNNVIYQQYDPGQLTMAAQNVTNQNNQWQQTFDTNKAQQQWENNFKQMGFNTDQANQMAQIAIQQQNANTSATSAGNQATYQQGQLAIDQQNANTNAQKAKLDASSSIFNDITQRLNSIYTYKDPVTGIVTVNPDYKAALRAAIIGQNLSDSDTDKLLLYYGLPVNQ